MEEEEKEGGSGQGQRSMTICLGHVADNLPDACFDFSNCTSGACR